MTYRSDIDGLRGVAVLLVIAYHAHFRVFEGGYVGVDIFFVISGFVITQMLVSQAEPAQLSLSEFFERRARRILPALATVLAACLVAGFFILGPHDLQELCKSIVAVTLLIGNLFFWRQRDYFADQAPPHPLLHTWSLGVEEQFYLLFPLLILWTKKPRQSRLHWMIAIGIVSLLACIVSTPEHPAAAFYLLPTRGWEFVLGGLVAISSVPARLGRFGAETMAAAGLLGILIAAVFFTGLTPFPGVAAILPCGGAALIIGANSRRVTFVSQILSWRGLAGIGLVSYSAYLWHWPIFTLSRSFLGRELTSAETIVVVAVVAILSFLSWKFIEKPFRAARAGTSGRGYGTAAILIGLGCIAAVAAGTLAGHGFPSRMSAQALVYEHAGYRTNDSSTGCHRGINDALPGKELCAITKGTTGPGVLLWGDSHANVIAPAIAAIGTAAGVTVWQASYSGCPPLMDTSVARTPGGDRCRDFNNEVFAAIQRLGIRRVILAAYWVYYASQKPDTALARLFDPYSPKGSLGSGDADENETLFDMALRKTVTSLQKRGLEVWIVDQVPVQREYVPNLITRTAVHGGNPELAGVKFAEHSHDRSFVHSRFLALVDRAHLLDPAVFLCGTGTCVCFADERVLYMDSNHLSFDGAMYIRQLFAPAFH